MNVDRVGAVMEVPRGPICAEKVFSIKIEAAMYVCFKFVSVQTIRDILKRSKVVSSMEVVDPILFGAFAIPPCAVGELPLGGVAGCSQGGAKQLCVSGVLVHTAEERSGKQICVMHQNTN